jgi:hypothetical protein
MKNLFPEFNQPSDEQFSELWKDALISFDANVLLNVFQYGHSTLHTFMDLLDQLQGRLWLTHQAAYEYQKNRNSRIRAQEVALKTPPALAKLEEVYRNIKNLHHPIIDYEDLSIAANDLIKAIQKPMQSSESMDKYRQRCAEMHARINTLFDGKVGDPYSPEDLAKYQKEAADRFSKLIPPGFMDKDKLKVIEQEKKDPKGILLPDPYGDAIIWFQLLDQAKSQKSRPIIFVTDDQKVDWWWSESGRSIGPRPELIAEMKKAGGSFYMYDSQNFMMHAAKYVSKPPTKENLDSAIKELQSVKFEAKRLQTERLQRLIDAGRVPEQAPRYRYISGKEQIGSRGLRFTEQALTYMMSTRSYGEIMEKITEICMRPMPEDFTEVTGADTTPSYYVIKTTSTANIVTVDEIDFIV